MMRLKEKGLRVYPRINRHVMLARDGPAVPHPRTYNPVGGCPLSFDLSQVGPSDLGCDRSSENFGRTPGPLETAAACGATGQVKMRHQV